MGPDEKWEPKPGERIDIKAGAWTTAAFTRWDGGRYWFVRDGNSYEEWNFYEHIAPLGTHTGAKPDPKPEPWVPAIGEECEGRSADGWHRGKYRGQCSYDVRFQIERHDHMSGGGDNGWWLVRELRPVSHTTPGMEPGKEETMHAYTWNIWKLNEKGERVELAYLQTAPGAFKNAENAKLTAWASFAAAGEVTAGPDGYEIDVIQVGK